MPRVHIPNAPRRMTARMTPLGTASRPSLQPSLTPTQPPASQNQHPPSSHPPSFSQPPSSSQPQPSCNQSPVASDPPTFQPTPTTSTIDPIPPSSSLGSHSHQSPTLSSPSPTLFTSSRLNEKSQHREEMNQALNASETAPSIDRRRLITIYDKKLPVEAFKSLKQIVHSYFDGPYICWSVVPENTLEVWWTAFKRLYKWDENLFLEEVVRVVFNSVGASHIRGTFGRTEKKKPVWIKQDIWDEMLHIWATNESYLHRSTTNKRIREDALQKGTPGYRGGSVNTTVHKKRLKVKLGKEPSVKETFIQCYSKNGCLSPAAMEILEKFDALVEKAKEEARVNGSTDVVDENALWIVATGGLHKKQVYCMGSESETIREQVFPYGTCGEPRPVSMPYCVDSLREEMTSGMTLELQKIDMALQEKLLALEERMNANFGQKVSNLEEKIEDISMVVEDVKILTEENSTKFQASIDQLAANQAAFFSSFKNMFK